MLIETTCRFLKKINYLCTVQIIGAHLSNFKRVMTCWLTLWLFCVVVARWLQKRKVLQLASIPVRGGCGGGVSISSAKNDNYYSAASADDDEAKALRR
jgi:hypothetical protein